MAIPSREIACDTLTISQLGLSSEELARVRRSRARIMLVGNGAYLLSRATAADTVWKRVEVQRRVWGGEPLYRDETYPRDFLVKLDTCNMNNQGLPEVLLTCDIVEGGKCPINNKLIHLLDISQTPRLLLSALVRVEAGINGANRKIGFGRELQIGSEYRYGGGYDHLTPLVPGRYRYQQGNLRRVAAK